MHSVRLCDCYKLRKFLEITTEIFTTAKPSVCGMHIPIPGS